MKIFKIATTTLGLIVGATTSAISVAAIAAAYAGYIDTEILPAAALLTLALPFLIALLVLTLIVTALWWRRSALIASVATALIMPQIAEVFPTGTGNVSAQIIAAKMPQRLTLLQYNCASWSDLTDLYPNGLNPTAQTILNINADIVCLQESSILKPNKKTHLDTTQINRIRAVYPYIIQTKWHLMLLSKYPATEINLGLAGGDLNADETTAYNIDRGPGTPPLVIYSLHLKSFNLTPHDKQFYGNITTVGNNNPARQNTSLSNEKSLLRKIKNELLSKVTQAGALRALQIKRLMASLRRITPGTDLIVCGDFNDGPASYALTEMQSLGLKQVYPMVGHGYMATFNRDKLWFHIDHTLFRGNLMPLQQQRLTQRNSDHYPLLTTFALPK